MTRQGEVFLHPYIIDDILCVFCRWLLFDQLADAHDGNDNAKCEQQYSEYQLESIAKSVDRGAGKQTACQRDNLERQRGKGDAEHADHRGTTA